MSTPGRKASLPAVLAFSWQGVFFTGRGEHCDFLACSRKGCGLFCRLILGSSSQTYVFSKLRRKKALAKPRARSPLSPPGLPAGNAYLALGGGSGVEQLLGATSCLSGLQGDTEAGPCPPFAHLLGTRAPLGEAYHSGIPFVLPSPLQRQPCPQPPLPFPGRAASPGNWGGGLRWLTLNQSQAAEDSRGGGTLQRAH